MAEQYDSIQPFILYGRGGFSRCTLLGGLVFTFFSDFSFQLRRFCVGYHFLAVLFAFILLGGGGTSLAALGNGTQPDTKTSAPVATPATANATSATPAILDESASEAALESSEDLQELEPDDAELSEEANLKLLFGIQAHRVMKGEEHLAPVRAAWKAVQARMAQESSFATLVKGMPSTIQSQWNYLEKNFKSMDAAKQLRAVNGFFNHFPSVNDKVLYGVGEYWATPGEFINKYGGDCEDYAIIKYRALLSLGWPAERMWIVGVDNATDLSQRHAVLAIRSEDMYFVLDNLSRPKYLIMPDKYYVKYYVPLFAVNDLGLWRFNTVSKVQKKTSK